MLVNSMRPDALGVMTHMAGPTGLDGEVLWRGVILGPSAYSSSSRVGLPYSHDPVLNLFWSNLRDQRLAPKAWVKYHPNFTQ